VASGDASRASAGGATVSGQFSINHLFLPAGAGEILAQPLASLLQLAPEPLGPRTPTVASGIAGAGAAP
jgi:hypothetical protein